MGMSKLVIRGPLLPAMKVEIKATRVTNGERHPTSWLTCQARTPVGTKLLSQDRWWVHIKPL